MKKISIFLLCALGIMAASCKEDIEPAPPQSNPQEPIMNAADDVKGVAVGPLALDADATFDLGQYDEPEAVVPVMQLTELKNMPAGGELVYKLVLSDTPDFAKSETIVATPGSTEEDKDIYSVSAEAWNNAQVALFGNSIKTKTVYYRVPVYISLADTEYRLESPSYYAASGELKINRMKPNYTIEEMYYVEGNFISGTPEMVHSDEDVYDDPSFTYTFEVTEDQAAAGFTVKIISKDANGNVAQSFGVAVPDELEGTLLEGGEALKVTVAGPYKLEVDMKALTYSLKVAPMTLYAITTGTNFNNCLQIGTSDFITYQGLARINKTLRFSGQRGWNPVHYGAAADGQAAADKGAIGATTFTINLATSHNGLAWITANLVKLNYEVQPIETLGICGELTSWGGTEAAPVKDKEFSHDKDFKVWTVEVESPAAGSQWKIRANNDWAINFGKGAGQYEPVFNSSDNFTFEDAGKYEIVFNCSALPYTLTVTKK